MKDKNSDGTTSALVRIRGLIASDRNDVARERLMHIWFDSLDEGSTLQEGRVALRLFERLIFSTDDQEAWDALPDPLRIYRAGEIGVSWTTDPEVAEHMLKEMDDDARVTTRTVAKSEVLAFITGWGETEVVVRPEVIRTG